MGRDLQGGRSYSCGRGSIEKRGVIIRIRGPVQVQEYLKGQNGG